MFLLGLKCAYSYVIVIYGHYHQVYFFFFFHFVNLAIFGIIYTMSGYFMNTNPRTVLFPPFLTFAGICIWSEYEDVARKILLLYFIYFYIYIFFFHFSTLSVFSISI